MDAEQTQDQIDALEAHKAEFQADFERRKAEELVKWEKKYAGKKLSKEKWRALNAPPATEVDKGLEPGEILSQSGSQPMPIRSADSSQGTTPASRDLLESFKPRKEPMRKRPRQDTPGRSDEFFGFGNTQATQETSQTQKQLPRLDTKRVENDRFQKPDPVIFLKAPTPADSTATTAASATTSKSKQGNASKTMYSTDPPGTAKAIKRSAPPTSGKNRTSALSKLPKIQKKSSVASPQSPERTDSDQMLSAVGDDRPPKWYLALSKSNVRDRNHSNTSTLLESLRGQIRGYKQAAAGDAKQETRLMEIRDKLHKVVFLEVDGQILRNNLMLHNESGLPQMFDEQYGGGVKWPYDIRADAEELYNKWARQDFETDILRGILLKGSKGEDNIVRNSDSIDEAYEGKLSYKEFGNNNLLNGQWWPYQICTIRDGAHGASQGGISGKKNVGAYSCIISGGVAQDGKPYPDEDRGDQVLYCGTDNDPDNASRRENGTFMPTRYTQHMIDSFNNKKPVRFIRSRKLAGHWAPQEGFRYDGLYDVESYKRLDGAWEPRQRHQFKLQRRPNQNPIRGGVGPQARPSSHEVEELRKHKRYTSGRD